MGSAQVPRIYFTGQQYWNPNTVNNNDYGGDPPSGVNTWDPPHADFDREYLKSKGVDTDEEIPPFLRKNIPYDPPTRKIPPAEWGLYGGQQCGFVTEEFRQAVNAPFSVPPGDTLTTGYTDVDGAYGSDQSIEPWVGQSLQFSSAKLVDVNPQSFWSSQIFAGLFTLGTPTNGFTGQPVARMHSRFITHAWPTSGGQRNYNSKQDLVIAATYGCVFQTCFDKSMIHFNGAGGPVRQGFQKWLEAGAQGLMLRYSAYRTLYFQGEAFEGMDPGDRYPMLEKMGELYEQFAGSGGDTPISRAYSKVNGWIGVWQAGELVNFPDGRFLIPFDQGPANDAQGKAKPPIAVTPSNLESEQYGSPPSDQPPNTDGPQYAPQPLGPATVAVATDDGGNPTRITLDLANTFPERDSTCVKADFGTAGLGLYLGESAPVKWVSQDVPYDQATYERLGGLVDFEPGEITKDDLASGSFFLQVESGQQGSTQQVKALWETLATAHTDTRGMYAEQPDPSFSDGDAPSPGPGMPSTAPTCTLQVRYAGSAPGESPSNPTMKLGWLALDYQLNTYSAGLNSSAAGTLPIEVRYKDPGGRFVPFEGPIDVPDDGLVEVQIVSRGAAIPNLFFLPWNGSDGQSRYRGAPVVSSAPGPPPSLVGFGSSDYVVIKCLNWDNERAVAFDQWLEKNPPLEAVNQAVWDLVFNTYFYGFPVMSFIDSPKAFQNSAAGIYQLTGPRGFDKPGYMPVTRTWSGGQRHVMVSYWKYLQKVEDLEVSDEVRLFESPPRRGLTEERSVSPTGETLGHG